MHFCDGRSSHFARSTSERFTIEVIGRQPQGIWFLHSGASGLQQRWQLLQRGPPGGWIGVLSPACDYMLVGGVEYGD